MTGTQRAKAKVILMALALGLLVGGAGLAGYCGLAEEEQPTNLRDRSSDLLAYHILN
jgi:hypothetical protein